MNTGLDEVRKGLGIVQITLILAHVFMCMISSQFR